MIFFFFFLNSKKALQKNEKIIYLENINRLYIAKISLYIWKKRKNDFFRIKYIYHLIFHKFEYLFG